MASSLSSLQSGVKRRLASENKEESGAKRYRNIVTDPQDVKEQKKYCCVNYITEGKCMHLSESEALNRNLDFDKRKDLLSLLITHCERTKNTTPSPSAFKNRYNFSAWYSLGNPEDFPHKRWIAFPQELSSDQTDQTGIQAIDFLTHLYVQKTKLSSLLNVFCQLLRQCDNNDVDLNLFSPFINNKHITTFDVLIRWCQKHEPEEEEAAQRVLTVLRELNKKAITQRIVVSQ